MIRQLLLGALVVLIMGGCGVAREEKVEPVWAIAVAKITVTPIKRVINTPTATLVQPVLTSPEERRWQADPVVIHIFTDAGYLEEPDGWTLTSELVVYADGTVIAPKYELLETGWYQRDFMEVRLPPAELCGLFLRLEYEGFFEHNLHKYEGLAALDSGQSSLEVKGWFTQQLERSSISGLIFDSLRGNEEYMPLSLATIFDWLWNFMPPTAEPYTPERVQVWVWRITESGTGIFDFPPEPQPWELAEFSLQQWMVEGIPAESGEGRVLLPLVGEEAERLWNYLGADRWNLYQEGEELYMVAVRPLFPLEERPLSDEIWGYNAPRPTFPTEPKREIDCTDPTLEPLPMEAYRRD